MRFAQKNCNCISSFYFRWLLLSLWCLHITFIFLFLSSHSASIFINFSFPYMHQGVPIWSESMPMWMSIMQCLQPSPAFIDNQYELSKCTVEPLAPWDDMCHQLHGKFSWTMKKVLFHWLLDDVPNYDWSILLTMKYLELYHSLIFYKLDVANAIISTPRLSYHLLHSLSHMMAVQSSKQILPLSSTLIGFQ